MDQIINATNEFLGTQISALQESIEKKDAIIVSLQDRMSAMSQRSYADSTERNKMVEGMQEWTMEAVEDGSITESQAEEIAEIMGFELTKEFEVEVEVQYSITVNARTEEEAKNAIYDIDFDTVSYNSDSIQYLSSSIDRVSI